MKPRWIVLMTVTLLPALACDAGGEADPESAPDAPVPEAPAAELRMTALPDTTARGVWSYLQEASYRETWRLWPGKGELYAGTEPHGMLLTTYLNDAAYEALTTGSGPLPAGSIVVKENYMPDSTLAAVTVMYAADGYDPEHNDWFWAKYQPGGAVDAAGRVGSCQSCHAAGERGFLRTPYEGGM